MGDGPVRTALTRGAESSFTTLAGWYLAQNLAKIEHAIARLDGDELWWRPAEGTNSIANLMLHLAGNLRLWIGEGVGGVACDRDRAGEFAARGSLDRDALARQLRAAVELCQGVLDGLDDATLDRTLEIQGYSTSVLGAILHPVEHMSYHTGQILFAAKQLLGTGHGIELYPQHVGE